MSINEMMDKISRGGTLPPFSQRFGTCTFLEPSGSLQKSQPYDDPCVSSVQKGMTLAERIDFSQESLISCHKRDDEDSMGTLSEKDSNAGDISYGRYTAGKNFPCPFKSCKKVYTSSYGLKYHIDHGHTTAKSSERRPYVCRIENCGKTYKNNNGLKYHITHAHKDAVYDESEMF